MVSTFFSSVQYSFWNIIWLVIFSALEAYWPLNQLCATKSPFIMFFLIMDFTQGYVFFWWHTLSFLYSFLSHQKLRPYWRKVWKASWVSFFLMIREKKCLPIFIFPLRLLWSEEESPAPRPGRIWTWGFRAVPGTCGRVKSPLVPTRVHPLVLPPSLKGASWALLCCSYSCGLTY